jgi:hypothetical protein
MPRHPRSYVSDSNFSWNPLASRRHPGQISASLVAFEPRRDVDLARVAFVVPRLVIVISRTTIRGFASRL